MIIASRFMASLAALIISLLLLWIAIGGVTITQWPTGDGTNVTKLCLGR